MQDAITHRKDCGTTLFDHARRPAANGAAQAGTGAVEPARATPVRLARHRQDGAGRRLAVSLALAVLPCGVPLFALADVTPAATVNVPRAARVGTKGGAIRIWPATVVNGDSIRVADVGELRGFDPQSEGVLAALVVAEAPLPGGSRLIHLEMVRAALSASGANMATVTLHGATECTVERPGAPVLVGSIDNQPPGPGGSVAGGANRSSVGAERAANIRGPSDAPQPHSSKTLRRAIQEYFGAALARYGGTADVVFGPVAGQALELSGPADAGGYEFRIRRREGSILGLVQLEVDVVSHSQVAQTVPVEVQVSMVRDALIARRAINQGATIQAPDVECVALTFTRLDRLGMDNAAQAIGQRAKRFISAGTQIEAGMIESVPLVTRGQLVTIASVEGPIRVVSAGRALQEGRLGEAIAVRPADMPSADRVEWQARVVGPGAVQIGGQEPHAALAALDREGRP